MRCCVCNVKLKLYEEKCKCGVPVCTRHRFPDQHQCTIDKKQEYKDKLEKTLPKISSSKITKI